MLSNKSTSQLVAHLRPFMCSLDFIVKFQFEHIHNHNRNAAWAVLLKRFTSHSAPLNSLDEHEHCESGGALHTGETVQ